MAAARGDGTSNDGNDFGRVYRAVAADQSEAQVRAVIEDVAKGSEARRVAAVNFAGKNNDANETPLACAHRLGRSDLVGALLEAGAKPDPSFSGCLQNPLALSIEHGQVNTLRFLLRSGLDVNQTIHGHYHPFDLHEDLLGAVGCTAVHLCLARPRDAASCRSQLACLEVLVREFGADINALDSRGAPPLTWVAYMQAGHDHEPAVNLLLELGADPQAGFAGRLAPVLEWCHRSNRAAFKPHVVSCLHKLAAAGARLTGLGPGVPPPLLLAAGANADVVRFLLEQGVPVDERDGLGRTALHHCKSEDMVAALLDAGADLEARDNQGRTPVFLCAQQVRATGLRALLARGASPDVRDWEGTTPMMAACTPDECDRSWNWLYDCDGPCVLLDHSSPDTLRAVRESDGFSAADCVVAWLIENEEELTAFFLEQVVPDPVFSAMFEEQPPRDPLPLHDLLGVLQQLVLGGVLAAGAPVAPEHAEVVLPFVAEHMLPDQQRAEIRLNKLRAPSNRWRGEDEIVQLAFDFVELREAEEGVRRREARVAELEEELRALGEGSEDTEDDEDEDEEEEEDEDEDEEDKEAGASGSKGGDESDDGAEGGAGGSGSGEEGETEAAT